MEIIAYEMKYVKDDIEKSNILCIPFEQKYFQQYMKISQPLPTKAGRFGLLLKQPKVCTL